jgi:hypothetical protein
MRGIRTFDGILLTGENEVLGEVPVPEPLRHYKF